MEERVRYGYEQPKLIDLNCDKRIQNMIETIVMIERVSLENLHLDLSETKKYLTEKLKEMVGKKLNPFLMVDLNKQDEN